MPQAPLSAAYLRKKKLQAAARATQQARATLYTNRRIGNTTAFRTGGWVNPVRGTELKFIDTVSVATVTASSSAAAVFGPLNKCIQGSDAVNRIGRKILLKSLYILWNGSCAATTAGASPLRLIVVYDKQTNTAATAATDILVTDNIYSVNQLNNRDRFVTLLDKWIPSVGTGGPQSWAKKYYKRLNIETIYNSGNAGTVSDIQSGSIYLFTYQNGNLITAAPTNGLTARIRFQDQ